MAREGDAADTTARRCGLAGNGRGVIRRETAQRLLAEHEGELKTLGVLSLALLGSVGRDEARPDSDADLLVEVEPGVGLFKLFDIQDRLQQVLGVKVDLVIREAVIEELREPIYRDAVHVF